MAWTRKQFLKWAAGGLALLTIGPGAVIAWLRQRRPDTRGPLDEREWGVVKAFADTIIPRTPDTPSASDVGVPVYLQRLLGDNHPRWKKWPRLRGYSRYLPYYHKLVERLDALSESQFQKGFAGLGGVEQEGIVTLLAEGSKVVVGYKVVGTPAVERAGDSDLFQLVRAHVIQGYLAEPAHGANKDYAGWEGIGHVCHHNYKKPHRGDCPRHVV